MEFAPVITANPSLFTRIYFTASLLVFSLLPLILTAMFAGSDAFEDPAEIQALIVEIATLQGLLWFAHHRSVETQRRNGRQLRAGVEPPRPAANVPTGLLVLRTPNGAMTCRESKRK